MAVLANYEGVLFRGKGGRERALQPSKLLGVYFAGSWCPECVTFTPDLRNFYEKANSEENCSIEVLPSLHPLRFFSSHLTNLF